MHRVRLLLPFFRRHGWQAEVLAVAPEDVRVPLDPWLAGDLPEDVPVHRVRALSLRWSRVPGLGGIGFRAMRALRAEGDRLLATSRFDLVYFSTTVFELHILGPRWKRMFGVPFVIDYQDPWVNDYYRDHPEVVPPGGRVKFAVADLMHRRMEPRVLRACSGITAVSADYPEQIRRRYPELAPLPALVQPFPGAQRDFDRLSPAARRDTAEISWIYAGRGGPDMATALRGLFLAVRDYAPSDLRENLRLHFIGTSYAPSGNGARSVLNVAEEVGIGRMVEEITDRIPYADALSRIRNADALIVPGSDDASYTASKIYPYLLARRPLLAIFHERSSVVDMMKRVGGGVSVPFATREDSDVLARRIAAAWLSADQYRHIVPLDEKAFEPYTDRGSAAVICDFFDRCIR